jgi:DNA polymerase I
MEKLTKHISDFDGIDILAVDTETFDYDEVINQQKQKEYNIAILKYQKAVERYKNKYLRGFDTDLFGGNGDDYFEKPGLKLIPLKPRFTMDIFSVCGKKGKTYIYGAFPAHLFNDFIIRNIHKPMIFHNSIYDLKVFKKSGVDIRNIKVHDTMAMARLLGMINGYGLKDLRVSVLKKESRDKYVEVDRSNEEKYYEYAGLDALDTYQLFENLGERIAREKLSSVYSLECEVVKPVVDMEYGGHWIDVNGIAQMKLELMEKIKPLEKTLNAWTNGIDLASAKQMGEFIYGELGVEKKDQFKTKTGFSVGKDVLSFMQRCGGKQREFADKLLSLRKYTKLLSTYVDGFIEQIKDGRIYGRFDPLGTATGRFCSKNPNLQNIATKDFDEENHSNIRKLFIPDPSLGKLTTADFGQLEYRMMAELSQDKNMKEIYLKDLDLHTRTAELLGCSRRVSKNINFGIGYGLTPIGLVMNLEKEGILMSEIEATEMINAFWKSYPRIEAMFSYCREQAKNVGYIRTISGRKRRFNYDDLSPSKIDRQVTNCLVQGGSADICKIALVRIYNNLPEKIGRIVSTVHDEFSIEHREEDTSFVQELLRWSMEEAIDASIPFKASIATGNNWYENK